MTAALILLSLFACSDPPAPPPPPAAPPKPAVVTVDPGLLKAFGSPTSPMLAAGAAAPTGAQVDLGRILYYEKRLSKNHDVSCNTCHLLDKYGVDGTPTSTGHKAQKGGRNAPTVYNAAGHIAQFWDGRAADVEAQAKGPVLNPIEMAMADEKSVVAVLETIPEYTPLFQAAFPGEEKPVTYDNMAKAIGAFERGLVTPSPFDRLLAGDQTALTDAQKAGLTTFVQSGCTTCHTGPLLGGGMYQKLGLVTPWPNPSDAGRFDVTKNEADKQLFKVPSLRNIEETGPYFHDGSVATLDEAIRLMGHHQLGRELSPEQVGSIQTFLGSLTGELPTAYIAEPPALASGPKTPKPDPS
jgi:cytochrome c peroxidase